MGQPSWAPALAQTWPSTGHSIKSLYVGPLPKPGVTVSMDKCKKSTFSAIWG